MALTWVLENPMNDHANSSLRPQTVARSGAGRTSPDRRRPAAVASGLALVLALAGQAVLTPPWGDHANVTLGAVLYAAAIFSILVAARGVSRLTPAADPVRIPTEAKRVSGRLRRTVGVALWPVGLIALALAVSAVAGQRTGAGIALWFGSLLLTAVGTGLAFGFPLHLPRSRSIWFELGAVLACLAVGFALRYVNLAQVPHQVHGDEAGVGLAARALLANNWSSLFGLGWYNQPEISFAAYALALKYLANNLYGLRLASVIQGSLAIPLLYGAARRLFNRRVAFLATAFLACAQMAVHYSRIGNNYIGALFASLLFLYLLLEAIHRRQPLLFLLAGFAGGLTLSVYIAARLTVVVAVLYCLYRALIERNFLRAQRRGFLLAFLGALIFVAPQGIVYSHGLGPIFDRPSGVFIFSPDNMRHEYDAYKVHTVREVLVRQAENTVAAFNLVGETSDQYTQRAPLLDFWSSALFVLGVAVACWWWRQPSYFLIGAWFWLTLLLGSVMTVDALFSPHLAAALGILALLPALALDVGWRAMAAQFGARGRGVATVIGMCLVLLSGYANAVGYFVIHDRAMAPQFFTVLARYAAAVNDRYRIYLLADADTSLNYDTIHFLTPNLDAVDVQDHPLALPLPTIPVRKGVAFVFRDPKDPRLADVQRAYPDGIEAVQRSTNNSREFTTYTVARAQLLAANPNALQKPRPSPPLDDR